MKRAPATPGFYFPSLKITYGKKEIPPARFRVIPNAATAVIALVEHGRLLPLC